MRITKNQFIGPRSVKSVTKALEELMEPDLFHSAASAVETYLNVHQLDTLECTTYNTLCVKGDSSDCRFRLRSAKCFHGRLEVSGMKLCNPKVVNDETYLYGRCLLFMSVGFHQLVIAKMMREVKIDQQQSEFPFLTSREIFTKIMKLYTCLNADIDSSKVLVININDVAKQEQFCDVLEGITLVNHFCWSNIYSSDC